MNTVDRQFADIMYRNGLLVGALFRNLATESNAEAGQFIFDGHVEALCELNARFFIHIEFEKMSVTGYLDDLADFIGEVCSEVVYAIILTREDR